MIDDFLDGSLTAGDMVVWPYQKGHWQCLIYGEVLKFDHDKNKIFVQPMRASRRHRWYRPIPGDKPVWILAENIVRVR